MAVGHIAFIADDTETLAMAEHPIVPAPHVVICDSGPEWSGVGSARRASVSSSRPPPLLALIRRDEVAGLRCSILAPAGG
jgi:hypothetical protein